MAWFSGWAGGENPTPLGTMPGSHSHLGSGPLNVSNGGALAAGDMVEYYSSSQGTWILAKVLLVNPSGTYNLDCKPDVSADKIRRPQGSSGSAKPANAGTSYAAGDMVEYYSASQSRWIPAKVLAANPKGTYNLDCKPDVSAEQIRRPDRENASPPRPLNTGSYAVGEMVEYYSPSQGKWIPAKVLAANAKGTYNLDCKPDVTTEKIRRMAPGFDLGSSGDLRAASAPQSTMGSFFSGLMAPAAAPRSQDLRPGSQNEPVQLIRVRKNGSRWNYEVCDEGARVLERHGSRRIAIASVCGLYRTGKSYLLNLLLERVQKGQSLFQVGSTSRPCTEGLWLWGSVDSDDDNRPLLAFIDCEGFGSTDSDKTRDAQLLTLCALLSSALILNTKGVLNESLFNALALTCKFAEHIEERGNEASRPALLWVLRDFMLELRDASGHPTSPDEYLEQALNAAPLAGHDQERGQGAREVRQSLLKFFSHRSCVTLVQPAIEERQLQSLSTSPYSSLRPEFRAGVEALRTQLITTCNSNPKTISGHPLGCFGFVALLRQLVNSMNESKALSIKGAWETVQHTACGSLSDELRNSACETLRTLAKGTPLPGGAQLPLTDEALRMVLRHQRHELKSQWEERAVGDEAVRKEYWQELKESLAREEFVVRQQNVRIADQRLVDALKHWQEWLDDENGTWASGERISKDLGTLFDQMPAAPLSRTSRAAIEAAGRRVASARSAVTATIQQSAEAQQQAVAFGEKAAQQHGAARSELENKRKEVQDHQESLRVARSNQQSTQGELERRNFELKDSKDQLQKLITELDDARVREHDHKAKHVYQTEKEAAMKSDFDRLHQDFAKAQADHLSSQRLKDAASDTWDAERRRMEAEITQLRCGNDQHGMEKNKLSTELEHAKNQASEKSRLETELEQLRAQARDKVRLEAELNEAKLQVAEKRRLEYELEHHKSMTNDKDRRSDSELGSLRAQAADTSRLQAELATEVSERKRLQSELDFAKSQAESYAQQLSQERGTLRGENERTRAEHMRMVEETRQKLEDERKAHSNVLEEEKNRLLDKERNAGVLEGKVHTLSSEAEMLRAKVTELQQKARETEAQRAGESEQMKQELERAKNDKVTTSDKLKEQADDYEKRLDDAEKGQKSKKKPKCGCSVM